MNGYTRRIQNIKFNWVKKVNNQLVDLQLNENTLKLDLRAKSDSGIYICSAENFLLGLKSKAVAFVNVE